MRADGFITYELTAADAAIMHVCRLQGSCCMPATVMHMYSVHREVLLHQSGVPKRMFVTCFATCRQPSRLPPWRWTLICSGTQPLASCWSRFGRDQHPARRWAYTNRCDRRICQ